MLPYICIYCEMITPVKLINTPISSHNYDCVCVMRTLKINSLSKCQVYSTVLLNTLYIQYNIIKYLTCYTLHLLNLFILNN